MTKALHVNIMIQSRFKPIMACWLLSDRKSWCVRLLFAAFGKWSPRGNIIQSYCHGFWLDFYRM